VIRCCCGYTIQYNTITAFITCAWSAGGLNRLSVWNEVQIVCIWSSRCHCILKPSYLLHHLNPDCFYLPGTGFSKVDLEKRPLNGCSCSCNSFLSLLSVTVAMLRVQLWIQRRCCFRAQVACDVHLHHAVSVEFCLHSPPPPPVSFGLSAVVSVDLKHLSWCLLFCACGAEPRMPMFNWCMPRAGCRA